MVLFSFYFIFILRFLKKNIVDVEERTRFLSMVDKQGLMGIRNSR